MNTTAESRTARLRTHLRIPRQVCIPATLWDRSASVVHWHTLSTDTSALSLAVRQEGRDWIGLEMYCNVSPQGPGVPLPRHLNFEVGVFDYEGVLSAPDQFACPVQLHSDRERVFIKPLNERSTEVSLRVRLHVPQRFRREPVLSNLTARYKLSSTILGALLGSGSNDDGWFDLELRGSEAQIGDGLQYLEQLGLQLWLEPVSLAESW